MLDLGCALSYTFGNIVNGKELPTHYVDPLALFYNDILDRYHIDRPRIRFGMAETLATVYPEGSVTFVHIRNALDHSADPMTAILQALVVLEKGGVLYCNHFRNEAERESYRGFHQFNIDMRGDKLIIWNKEETIDVGAVIAPFANLRVSETNEGRVVAVITKTADIPQEVAGCAHAAQTTSRILMTSVGYFHSAPNAISYQFSRLWSAAGHNLMRLLPYSLLNRVKRWMGNKS